GDPHALVGAEGTLKHGHVNLHRVHLHNGKDNESADHQSRQQSHQADRHRLPHRQRHAALGYADQWFGVFVLILFHAVASLLRWVIIRPTSSFVVVRASTMPLTLPAQSTRIRSHSSKSASRSSPT